MRLHSFAIMGESIQAKKPSIFYLVALAIFLAGCGRLDVSFGPLLSDVTVSPDQISPNADGQTDVTEIRYTLSRSAYVSIYFEGEEGDRYFFRKNRRRSPGNYSVLWGGVMDEREIMAVAGGTNEILSQVLPDGRYRWIVEAVDDTGHSEALDGAI